jgi:hypothetical protein
MLRLSQRPKLTHELGRAICSLPTNISVKYQASDHRYVVKAERKRA